MTKAHETLTRRPGGSSVSVSRVRRRQARHKPSGLEGAVPIARGTPKAGLTGSRLPMAAAVSKGLIDVDLPEEAFQRGAPCGAASPHVPGPVDDVTNRVSGCPPVPVPSHCPVRASRRTSGPSTRGPTSSTTSETRLAALPLTTSRGRRGTRKAFPEGADDDWRYPAIRAVRAVERWSTCLGVGV